MTNNERITANNAELREAIELAEKLPDASGGVADPIIEPLEITENGTYTAPDGVDGYSPVTVNVPTGGGGENLDKLLEETITEVSSAATSIKRYAFQNCKSLVSASFPNAKKINADAFSYCDNLVSVEFPNVTNVGSNAFYNCTRLASVTFPKVTGVDGSAFYNCTNLASVDFPNATSIGAYAFRGGYLLKTVILRSSTMCTLANKNAFTNCYHILGTKNATYNPNGDKDGYIYVPRDLVDSYKSASNWSNYASQFRAIEDYPEITGG